MRIPGEAPRVQGLRRRDLIIRPRPCLDGVGAVRVQLGEPPMGEQAVVRQRPAFHQPGQVRPRRLARRSRGTSSALARLRLEQHARPPVPRALLFVPSESGLRGEPIEPRPTRRAAFPRSSSPRRGGRARRCAARSPDADRPARASSARSFTGLPLRLARHRPGCSRASSASDDCGNPSARQRLPERTGGGLPFRLSSCASTYSARDRTSASAQRNTTCASATRASRVLALLAQARAPGRASPGKRAGRRAPAGVCATSSGVGWCCSGKAPSSASAALMNPPALRSPGHPPLQSEGTGMRES